MSICMELVSYVIHNGNDCQSDVDVLRYDLFINIKHTVNRVIRNS